MKDWRQALNSSPTYRVGNGTVRFQTKFVTVITFLGLILLIFLYTYSKISSTQNEWNSGIVLVSQTQSPTTYYNKTYPLTAPIHFAQGTRFRIGIIADMDTDSKSKKKKDVWLSYLKKGYLTWNSVEKTILINWDERPIILKSSYGLAGRGMELSELVVFDGKLLVFDDRTGIVYRVMEDTVIPWIILTDGNGNVNKGFKTEWATVKDQKLITGSMGKEWTSSTGEFINLYPMWIKNVTSTGEITHINWNENYKKLRRAAGIEYPGYMIHEAGVWSSEHNKWFFLPRRASFDKYDDLTDEYKSTNVLLSADRNFDNIQVQHIGNIVPTRGYSSFKFIPTTNDNVIIALKSEEYNGTCATYITGFTVNGEVLLQETKIADIKYEGIEFI